mmetsp:Transcript_8314/g.11156  ORF Transcript_8314/g.11156 Transcript_8314/m.11156 type:complete len:116 (+) Transcript_8314:29-376(+)
MKKFFIGVAFFSFPLICLLFFNFFNKVAKYMYMPWSVGSSKMFFVYTLHVPAYIFTFSDHFLNVIRNVHLYTPGSYRTPYPPILNRHTEHETTPPPSSCNKSASPPQASRGPHSW